MSKRVRNIRYYLGYKSIIYILIIILFVIAFNGNIFAKDYSYNDLGLDYNVKRYLYSTGKNGYKFIYVTSKKGSGITYKMARVEYDDLAGHDVFSGYGKIYIAKLSRKTKYYIPIEWSSMSVLQPYKYGYNTDRLKSMKILREVSRKTALNYMNLFYAKIKGGKIITMISPAIFAI